MFHVTINVHETFLYLARLFIIYQCSMSIEAPNTFFALQKHGSESVVGDCVIVETVKNKENF